MISNLFLPVSIFCLPPLPAGGWCLCVPSFHPPPLFRVLPRCPRLCHHRLWGHCHLWLVQLCPCHPSHHLLWCCLWPLRQCQWRPWWWLCHPWWPPRLWWDPAGWQLESGGCPRVLSWLWFRVPSMWCSEGAAIPWGQVLWGDRPSRGTLPGVSSCHQPGAVPAGLCFRCLSLQGTPWHCVSGYFCLCHCVPESGGGCGDVEDGRVLQWVWVG